MGYTNRKTMQIEKELLSGKNYTGSRLILIENEDVKTLQDELSAYQQEINPILEKLSSEYYPTVDPLYQEVQKKNQEIKEIKEKIAEQTEKFKPDIESIEAVEKKALLIKQKLQPIILDEVKDKLGEFETARNTVVQDGKIYVEVIDEIEEKIKQIRASKLNK